MVAENPLDTTIAVVTPENIAFDYQLAGPCRRFPAYIVDVFARWIFIIAVFIALSLAGLGFGFSGMSYVGMAMITILLFVTNWFYGTFFEAYFNGRTIGKWACGIRVIDVDGRPVTGRSALLRNLLRVADMAPVLVMNDQLESVGNELFFFFIVPASTFGILSMLLTRRMQRLGDLAAGTMVVVDERSWRLPVAKVDDPRVPALSSYVPADYRVTRTMARTLGIYVERRHYLTPARRNEIAKHLTDGLVERFEFRPDINPDLLLYALYYKTYLQDSNAEEPDLGPLRGYSPLARDADKLPASVLERGTASPLTETVVSTAGTNATQADRKTAGQPRLNQNQLGKQVGKTDAPKKNPLQGGPPAPGEGGVL